MRTAIALKCMWQQWGSELVVFRLARPFLRHNDVERLGYWYLDSAIFYPLSMQMRMLLTLAET